MMTRFSARIGAAVLIALSLVYLGLALATGHSARAETPPSLAATEAKVNVWRAVALLVDGGETAAIIDVRPAAEQALYRLPVAVSLPGASAQLVRERAAAKRSVVLVASNDERALKLANELASGGGDLSVHVLEGGARSWYLAFELPAPLFSTKPPPYGYTPALATVKEWLARPQGVDPNTIQTALRKLIALDFQPDQLAVPRKPKASGKKKKITGGCG